MRLLSRGQVPLGSDLARFRQGRFAPTFFALIMSGVTGALFVFGWHAAVGWPFFLFGGFNGLITLIILSAARAVWKSSNWTVLAARDGLYVNARSYMNHHFPVGDSVIAFLPYREIDSIRVIREKLVIPGSIQGHTRQTTQIDLELRLRHAETAEFAQTIEREKSRTPPGRIRSWSPHRPVEAPALGTILVHWRNGNSHLTPKVERFLEAVAGKVSIEKEAPAATRDYRAMSDQELEQLAAKLGRAGEKMQAMTLLHQKFGGTLTEAKQRLERITQSPD